MNTIGYMRNLNEGHSFQEKKPFYRNFSFYNATKNVVLTLAAVGIVFAVGYGLGMEDSSDPSREAESQRLSEVQNSRFDPDQGLGRLISE
jgi:hypothetical protein|tara:strand:- start:432 stop:701 length:270 start_codon:yes stop_codon:yes gene_type:complete